MLSPGRTPTFQNFPENSNTGDDCDALYWRNPPSSVPMRSTDTSDSEQLLKNLVHDLRQPLGNIETSIYLLLRTANPQTREQIRIIEHQVERASALLSEAAAELNRRHAVGKALANAL